MIKLMNLLFDFLLLSPLLLFVLLPAIYLYLARESWEYARVCFYIFVFLHFLVELFVWNNEEYHLLFPLFALVTQAVVCVICHVIWWCGYRNDSSESKK